MRERDLATTTQWAKLLAQSLIGNRRAAWRFGDRVEL
jgi:hypothetical protein